MHDLIVRNEQEAVPVPRLTKANECIIAAKQLSRQEMLFDEFWRQGELALLFGGPGTGKSVLAMQIADRLARGRGIHGFDMPKKRQKVLYVDLKLSERQFMARYSHRVPGSRRVNVHKFSENLYRAAPGQSDNLCEWLRAITCRHGIHIVVIDDLSSFKTTAYGSRETLKLMRDLRELRNDLDLSILVLAGARDPVGQRRPCESDMQRERVLCDVADSVFGIAWHQPNFRTNRCILQTRSSAAPLMWTAANSPICRIIRTDDGFLEFEFDERFEPQMDQDRLELICNINAMRRAGASWRLIAEDLGVSKTTAARLCKLWRPQMHRGFVRELDEEDESDDGGENLEIPAAAPLESDEVPHDAAEAAVVEPAETVRELDTRAPPAEAQFFDSMPALLRALGMYPDFDGYGREIFVELADERGKPKIWYKLRKNGRLTRCERSLFTVISMVVDGPISSRDRPRDGPRSGALMVIRPA